MGINGGMSIATGCRIALLCPGLAFGFPGAAKATVAVAELEACLQKQHSCGPDSAVVKCVNDLVQKGKGRTSVDATAAKSDPSSTEPKKLCPDGHSMSWTECYREFSEKRGESEPAPDKPAESAAKPGPWLGGNTRKVIEENWESSYFTAGSGKRFSGDRTGNNILYEGQVFANIHWHTGEWKWLKAHAWWDIPIRIAVRQLTDLSKPVKTPTYNPGVRLYLAPMDDGSRKAVRDYVSIGIHHYSNGQSGQFTSADGFTANTDNGSFSTNYAEMAWHRFGGIGAFNWMRLSLRQHFYKSFDEGMHDQYEKRHVALMARTREFTDIPPFKGTLPIHLKLSGSYGWGYDYLIKANDPARSVRAHTRDKINATLELVARPNAKDISSLQWKDVALYLRYDYGHDYYNIRFQNRINRLQFGVVTTNLVNF